MGRRAHVRDGDPRFQEFMQTVPEDVKHGGWWLVWKEVIAKSGGFVRNACGHIPFEPDEVYDSLKDRIKEHFGHRGPGEYSAASCDESKKEIKTNPIIRFSFTEEEIPMPPGKENGTQQTSGDPLRDTLSNVKKVQKDMVEMKAMEAQARILNNMLGGGNEEDDEVKEAAATGNQDLLSQMMLMKMLNGEKDGTKGVNSDLEILKAQFQSQIETLKSQLAAQTKAAEEAKTAALFAQATKGKSEDDTKLDRLLNVLLEERRGEKEQNVFQSMMAMMIKQQDIKEAERAAEDKRREEERKDERTRLETQLKADKEKFEKELEEQKRRFDAELLLRREEIKAEAGKAATLATEQQKLQLQMLSIMKDGKDNSIDTTKTIVETLTGAGLASMKTAQDAAQTIMSIAKKAEKEEKPEKDDGLGGLIKDIGSIAAPLLAPYADADAKMKMLKSVQHISGAGGMEGVKRPRQTSPNPPPAPVQTNEHVEASATGPSPAAQASPTEGMPNMVIVAYLQKFPEIKYALLGNLRRKLGVDKFIPIITGLDQPTLEGLIANLDPVFLMREIMKACTPEEQKLIAENQAWFTELQEAMIDELESDMDEDLDEEDLDEDEEEGEEGEEEGEEEPVQEKKPPVVKKAPKAPVKPATTAPKKETSPES